MNPPTDDSARDAKQSPSVASNRPSDPLLHGLSARQLELLNAHGPYNHAVWRSGPLEVTHEERLAGRGERLVEVIRRRIRSEFSDAQIADMRILDIGCYDGWLLHQLSDMPFREMIGIEPRAKNIEKGRQVREILGISTRVEFRQAALESLEEDPFDVVLCVGLLHHLPSLAMAFDQLRSICSRLLVIDTLCLSSDCLTPAFQHEIEMKDLVYRYKPRQSGITGHKYESAYYDGSTNQGGIVNVPSLDVLRMYLDAYGFSSVQELITMSEYREILQPGGRQSSAVCLAAVPDGMRLGEQEDTWIEEYESSLMRAMLDRDLVLSLYQEIAGHTPELEAPHPLTEKILAAIRAATPPTPSEWEQWGQVPGDDYQLEIVANLRFNPIEKITLELAKHWYHEQRYTESVDLLVKITQRLNADWRAAYRAFFLLSRCFARLNDEQASREYLNLCRISNERFPIAALQDY